MISFLSVMAVDDDFYFSSVDANHFAVRCVNQPNTPLCISVVLLNPPQLPTTFLQNKIAELRLTHGDATLHMSLRIRKVMLQETFPNRFLFLELGNEQMLLPVDHRSFQNVHASSLFRILTKKYAKEVRLLQDPIIASFSVTNPVWSLQSLAFKTGSLVAFAPQSISVIPLRKLLPFPSLSLPLEGVLYLQFLPTSLWITTHAQLQWQILETILPGFWIDKVIHSVSSHPQLGRSFTRLRLRHST